MDHVIDAEVCKSCTEILLWNPHMADERYDLRIESKMNYDTNEQKSKVGSKSVKQIPAPTGQRPKTLLQCVDSRVERIERRLQKVKRG